MIVVVGDVLLDVVVTPDGPTARGSDTPATIITRQGGSAASTAAWLARLGIPVTLVAAVGDDGPGTAIRGELTTLGVTCAFAVKPGLATGSVVAVVTSAGEHHDRDMYTSRGASGLLAPADLTDAIGSQATHVHLSGYTLLHPGSRSAGLAAIGAARAAGVPISVDPASTAPLAEVGAEAFLEWVGRPVLLTPNLDEGRLLTSADTAEEVATALAARCGEAVVTCGADGVVWSDGNEILSRSAPAVPGGDPVGAGDAFTAGFLAARTGGLDVGAQLDAGLRTAERALLRSGPPPG
ncbi:carbohydrate kinase family protein [Euzebya tangerina]|uniref:carbohydrate kinase family protein n=1 Tax=Euzebya tangerina TaxID=591198 RepID=UPI000E30F69A|nr:PfkB family carbohydrate kinase [Euzebya tangerina]